MIFGGVAEDRLQLNESTLYSDEPGRRDLPLDVAPEFDRVVEMLRRGEYSEAAEIISRNWCGRAQPCYQPLGDLWIKFTNPPPQVDDYRRELDLDSGIARVSYRTGNLRCTREIFSTAVDQVLVVHLACDQPGSISFSATLNREQDSKTVAVAPGRVSGASSATR